MKILIPLFICAVILSSCGSPAKNPAVRDTVKKSVSDSLSLGLKEYRAGHMKSAESYFEDALRSAYSIDNSYGVIDASQKLSELYLRVSNYTGASNYIFAAKSLSEKENMTSQDFILDLTIGKFYEKAYETPDGYKKAYSYYEKASQNASSDADRAGAYNNMGIADKKLQKLDDAASWFEKARSINEGAQIYDALGDNYYYLGGVWDDKRNYGLSLTNYFSALKYDKIAEKSGAILEDLKSIAGIYFKMGKNEDSSYYYMKALNTAQSINAADEAASIRNTLNYLQKTSP